MNAHSSFKRASCRSLKVRVRSRAFQKGLREGFGAVALFDAPREYRLTKSVDASIGGTWKALGDAIKEASKFKEADLGKATREAEPAE